MATDILIVDDEADIRDLIAGVLSDEGYETRVAADSATALAAVRARRPSMVILDIWLQGSELDGLGILNRLKTEHPDLPVIMISGHGNIETAVAAIKSGAYDFIEKPFKTDRLLVMLERAFEAARLRRENQELKRRMIPESEMIGSSPAINVVRSAIERVARTNSRVLITGPAGSGKEVAARLLHAKSLRADGPFVVVNAATMAPERVESELFGIEPAADPSGKGKVGTFEQAHGGTLFIDELADMPIETQAKILRVLLDQTFERVGGRTVVEVDVRVVSASSRDLNGEIAAGRFRADLFHRLNVVPIHIPPLCDRREDVPELSRFFMRSSADASGLPGREISDEAMAVLQANEWPGNVRQLRNLVEQLLIMSPGDPATAIKADALPAELGNATPEVLRLPGVEPIMGLPLREAREVFERQYLVAQIMRFGGNVSRTAAFIGMERSALHRKLKTLGVQPNGRAIGIGG